MSLTCPKSGKSCENLYHCTYINAPLEDAIPTVRRAAGGLSWALAKTALRHAINSNGNSLVANLYPVFEGNRVIICPEEIFEGDTGRNFGITLTTEAMHGIAASCLREAIEDVRRTD